MSVAAMDPVATIQGMPPKKTGKLGGEKAPKVSGKHTTKRIGVNFTAEWHAVLRKLAGKKKQPVVWYLMDLAREDAKRNGVETPPLPWEEGATAPEDES